MPSGSGWVTVRALSGRPGELFSFGESITAIHSAPGLARSKDRPGDHRPPADGMQHLRQRGTHARSLARRHYEHQGRLHRQIVEGMGQGGAPFRLLGFRRHGELGFRWDIAAKRGRRALQGAPPCPHADRQSSRRKPSAARAGRTSTVAPAASSISLQSASSERQLMRHLAGGGVVGGTAPEDASDRKGRWVPYGDRTRRASGFLSQPWRGLGRQGRRTSGSSRRRSGLCLPGGRLPSRRCWGAWRGRGCRPGGRRCR